MRTLDVHVVCIPFAGGERAVGFVVDGSAELATLQADVAAMPFDGYMRPARAGVSDDGATAFVMGDARHKAPLEAFVPSAYHAAAKTRDDAIGKLPAAVRDGLVSDPPWEPEGKRIARRAAEIEAQRAAARKK